MGYGMNEHEYNLFLLPFRASDDLEKTNTTYAEDSQPTQGKSCSLSSVFTPLSPSPGLSWSSLTQRSPFIWMNQMLSRLQAVTMESQNDLFPLVRLAAESPSMSRHFTNRRRRLRTKHAGSDILGVVTALKE